MAQISFLKASALQYLLGKIAEVSRDVQQDLAGQAALHTPSFTSRALAARDAQALPAAVNIIIVREGNALVIRNRYTVGDDPLYGPGTTSRFGVLIAVDPVEMRINRVQHSTINDINSLNLAQGTDQISVATNEGHYVWRRLAGPPPNPNPDTQRQSRDGRWWQLAEDTVAIKASVQRAMDAIYRAGFAPVSNVGGTGNVITGTYPPGFSVVPGVRVSVTPILTNTGPALFNTGQIRTESNEQMPAGSIIPGHRLLLERDSTLNVWRVISVGMSVVDMNRAIATALADVQSRLTGIDSNLRQIETIDSDEGRAIMRDSSGNAVVVWRHGPNGGFDMPMAAEFWERAPIQAPPPSENNGPTLSTTEIDIIGFNGQSLSLGGNFANSIVSRNALIAGIKPGYALMLDGMARSDSDSNGQPIRFTQLDMPRVLGYNETVPATGFVDATPSLTMVTAAWPMATALNEYRRDLGLQMRPVLTQVHGVSGIRIEDLDDLPETGSGVTAAWRNFLYWTRESKRIIEATGRKARAPAHGWVHGTSAKSYAEGEYLAQLWRYKHRMQEEIRLLGLDGPATMLVSQPGGFTDTRSENDPWHVVDEVLQFCEQGGGILTTPEYAYEIEDDRVHPDAYATIQFSEVKARAQAETEAGRRWTIGSPDVVVSGNQIVMDFDSLRPGEYLDRHDPARYAGRGIDQFLGFQAEGTTITSIETRGTYAVLNCTGQPTGVRYAFQKQDVRGAGNRWTAHRGLLRTSDVWDSKILSGVKLYRWIPSFKITF